MQLELAGLLQFLQQIPPPTAVKSTVLSVMMQLEIVGLLLIYNFIPAPTLPTMLQLVIVGDEPEQ